MLLYSSPETFEPPADVMFLGWNPGGGKDVADRHPYRMPFDRPRGWSPYLDETWEGFEKGEHPMQRAVQSIAELIAGGHGTDLIRASPAGNLIPFRSEASGDLPRVLREEGARFGLDLIGLAHPRLLVLLSGKKQLWEPLMRRIEHVPEPDWQRDVGANHVFREARYTAGGVQCFVFALPGVNTNREGRNREVIDLFRQRLRHHELPRDARSPRSRLVKARRPS